jgi:hypothetical protein
MNTLLVFRLKKNWKIPNGSSEVLYGRKTENAMAKRKTNGEIMIHITTQKAND